MVPRLVDSFAALLVRIVIGSGGIRDSAERVYTA